MSRDQKRLELCAELAMGRAYRFAFALVGSHHDAEGIVAQSLVVATAKSDQIPRRVWPWFAAIVTFEARNHRRKRARRGTPEPLPEVSDSKASDPLEAAISSEGRERLWQAVQNLEISEREAITLVFVAGMSRREAAKVRGISATSLRRELDGALAKVRHEIGVGDDTLRAALPLLIPALSPSAAFAATLKAGATLTPATLTAGAGAIAIWGVTMKKIAVLIILLLLLIGGAGIAYFGGEDEAPTVAEVPAKVQSQDTPRVAPTPENFAAPTSPEALQPEAAGGEAVPMGVVEAPPEEAEPVETAEPIMAVEDVETLYVQILGEDGKPVKDARINWGSDKPSNAFTLLQQGKRIKMMLGYGFQDCGEFTVTSAEYETIKVERVKTETQIVRLTKHLPVTKFRFKISLPDGRPLPNGEISLRSRQGEVSRIHGKVHVDGKGETEAGLFGKFDSVTQFSGQIHFGGGLSAIAEHFSFTLGEALPATVFWVASPDLLVEGRLVDEKGQGVSNAEVEIDGRERLANGGFGPRRGNGTVRSDEQGRFYIGLGKARELRIKVVPPDGPLASATVNTEVPADVAHHDLGDLVLQEMARVDVTVTLDGAPLPEARVRFRNAPRLFFGKLNDDGKYTEKRFTKTEIRDATRPLQIEVATNLVTTGWVEIRAAALAGTPLVFDLKSPKLGTLVIEANKEDKQQLSFPIMLRFAREGDDFHGLTIEEPNPRRDRIESELAVGRYVGHITSRLREGAAMSADFTFEIREGETTMLTPDLLGLASLDLVTPEGESDATTVWLRQDPNLKLHGIERMITLGGQMTFSPVLHYAPNSQAKLGVEYRRKGKTKRAYVDLPVANEFEKVKIDISETIAKLRAALEE